MLNLLTIPPSLAYLEEIAKIILNKYKDDPLKITDLTVIVETQKTKRDLSYYLMLHAKNKNTILPEIFPISDIIDEEFVFFEKLDSNKKPIGRLEEILYLTRIIGGIFQDKSITKNIFLAKELSDLFFNLKKNKIDLSKIQNLTSNELAGHWQKLMDHLQIITESWPKILEANNKMDKMGYLDSYLTKYVDYLLEMSPDKEIICAGIMGDYKISLHFMKNLSRLKNHLIILPPFNKHLSDDYYQNIDEFNPFYLIKNQLTHFGVDYKSLSQYGDNDISIQEKIMQEVMCPSSLSHNWQNLKPMEVPDWNVDIIECENLSAESKLIAIKLLDAYKKNLNVTFATSSRPLALRVKNYLKKWEIEVEDYEGTKLDHTKTGKFLLLINSLIFDFSSVNLLALLKHPFAYFGYERNELNKYITKLEQKILRKPPSPKNLSELKNIENEELKDFIDRIIEYLSPYKDISFSEHIELQEAIALHIKTAENIASSPNFSGAWKLWTQDEGRQISAYLSNLQDSSKFHGKVKFADYHHLIQLLLVEEDYFPVYNIGKQISFSIPREARLLKFDLVIIGDMNEGSFPREINYGPWISTKMSEELGLPKLQQQIGMEAYDFHNLMLNKNIMITRSKKIDGTETVASKFLLRLKTVFEKIGLKEKLTANNSYLMNLLSYLIEPNFSIIQNKNLATPPVEYRPKQISVTKLEMLMHDPYSYYASDILKLRPQRQLDEKFSAMEFGIYVHKALEYFYKQNQTIPLDQCLKLALGNLANDPYIQNFWFPKIRRVASYLEQDEILRLTNQSQHYLELAGEINLLIGNQQYKITAKADRIDIISGKATIIDFKTGKVPSKNDVLALNVIQLACEALILQQGGFKIGHIDTEKLYYICLSGGHNTGESSLISDRMPELTELAKNKITETLELYTNPKEPYRPNPDTKFQEYKHLSRIN